MSYSAVSGATLDKIGTAIQQGANVISAAQGQQFFGQQQLQQESGMPDWVLPVVLVGGLGLVAFLVMKKGPTKNPSKRRAARGDWLVVTKEGYLVSSGHATKRAALLDRDRKMEWGVPRGPLHVVKVVK